MLKSKYRWALSGTPLQNRVNELYSQVTRVAHAHGSTVLCLSDFHTRCRYIGYGTSGDCFTR